MRQADSSSCLTQMVTVIVLYGDEKDIESIIWDSEKDRAEITVRSDDRGTYLWAEYTDKKKEKDQNKSFKVGKDGVKLRKNLSPMVAIRNLKDLSAEKIEEIGLKDSKTSMTIIRKGKESVQKSL